MVSLVIPYIDEHDVTLSCLKHIADNSVTPDLEVILISNGSREPLSDSSIVSAGFDLNTYHLANEENVGVLASFQQGFEESHGDVVCFIHNDVLIQERGWDQRVQDAFDKYPRLGMAGLFGAKGTGKNGGRIEPFSNMVGLEWGRCNCHAVAGEHHGRVTEALEPCAGFDGVGLFFRRDLATRLVMDTDMFADWRAPHHFYDRVFPLKAVDLGYKLAVIGIAFDHWSGKTANGNPQYQKAGRGWLAQHGEYDPTKTVDQQIYNIAEKQFFDEFGPRLPLTVDNKWEYAWEN